MHFGYYISGIAHLVLLMGLLVGPVFQKEVDPIEYSSVSLISEQDFIDLTASNISPLVSEETNTFTPMDENDDKLNFKTLSLDEVNRINNVSEVNKVNKFESLVYLFKYSIETFSFNLSEIKPKSIFRNLILVISLAAID